MIWLLHLPKLPPLYLGCWEQPNHPGPLSRCSVSFLGKSQLSSVNNHSNISRTAWLRSEIGSLAWFFEFLWTNPWYGKRLLRWDRFILKGPSDTIWICFKEVLSLDHRSTEVLLFGTAIYVQEDRSNIPSMPHSLWLALVTMTTVGYGDYFPVSMGGAVTFLRRPCHHHRNISTAPDVARLLDGLGPDLRECTVPCVASHQSLLPWGGVGGQRLELWAAARLISSGVLDRIQNGDDYCKLVGSLESERKLPRVFDKEWGRWIAQVTHGVWKGIQLAKARATPLLFCASFEGKILGHLYRREDTKFADEILLSPHKYPNLGIYPGSAMDMVILAGLLGPWMTPGSCPAKWEAWMHPPWPTALTDVSSVSVSLYFKLLAWGYILYTEQLVHD